jgi:hypothetical protein
VQILVVQDSRPLYTWAETKLRPSHRDNWDPALEKPAWLLDREAGAGGTVGELTAEDEAGSGDGSYSGSDRDAESGSEEGSEDEEDGDNSVSVSKSKGGTKGDGLQTVKEEASVGGSLGAGSVASRKSSVVSATILKPRRIESAEDAPDDVSAMSGSAY